MQYLAHVLPHGNNFESTTAICFRKNSAHGIGSISVVWSWKFLQVLLRRRSLKIPDKNNRNFMANSMRPRGEKFTLIKI